MHIVGFDFWSFVAGFAVGILFFITFIVITFWPKENKK